MYALLVILAAVIAAYILHDAESDRAGKRKEEK